MKTGRYERGRGLSSSNQAYAPQVGEIWTDMQGFEKSRKRRRFEYPQGTFALRIRASIFEMGRG